MVSSLFARGDKHSILDTVLQQLPVALVSGRLLLLKYLTVTPERLKSTGMLVTTVFSSGKNGKDCHWQAQKDKNMPVARNMQTRDYGET